MADILADTATSPYIVVADDSPLLAAIVQRSLSETGHRVVVVGNGQLALDLVLSDDPPDLLVTDGEMPGLGGLELCRRIRSAGITLPIIFLTASPGQLVAALAAGANDFLSKPFEPVELVARVDAALRAGRMAAELAAERDHSAALMGSLQDGVMALDAQGRILSANARLAAIVGLRREALIGMEPPYPFWPEADADHYARALFRAIDRGQASEADRHYRRPDGERVDVIVSLARVAAAPVALRRGVTSVCTVKDVSARREAERALRDSESRHRALARDHARLGRVATMVALRDDPTELFSLVAREVAGLLGADAGGVVRFDDDAQVLVGSWSALAELHIAPGERLEASADGATAQVRRRDRAARVDREDGGLQRCSVAAPVRLGGRLWGAVGAVNSGTNAFPLGAERRLEAFATLVGAAVTGAAARAELAAQALTDPLTGLANRRCFNLRLEQELQIAATRRGPLALLLFDVDRFKVVNDTHGHDVGDQVLREIARRLQRDRRVGDLVARVGGEEFALLLPGASLTAAVPLAERACEAVGAAPIGVAGRCTVSCGVVAWAEGDTTRTLMRRADDQLYRAKEGGRDRVAIDGVPGTLPGDPAAVSPPALPRS